VIVERRFRGPDNSGNGGYSAGLFAQLVDGDAEVTLRAPPPLDTELRVDGLDVYDGDTLVAEVRPASVELELPEPVSYDEALRLQRPPDPNHPFPHCFVCGPEGEGLRLRPSPVGDGRAVAAWRPEEIRPELVWAALDCPGAFAVDPDLSRGATVLGRLAAHIEELPAARDELVVVAWPLPGGDGRRSYAGTSLFRGKKPLAWARATWFSVQEPLPSGG
jgi:hypothetical protein